MVAIRKTLYLDPDFILAHITLSSFARKIGRAEEAARHLKNASRLLERLGDEDTVPESEGLTAGRLREVLANVEDAET
jgi:chemotaxis protein methyltransferase CheR